MPENVLNKQDVKSFLTICSLISSRKPVLITRASGVEGSVLEFALRKRSANGSPSDLCQRNLGHCIKRLANNAGILIKNNRSLDVFVDSNITANLDSDAILVWDGGMGEQFQYYLRHLINIRPELRTFDAHGLEPYYFFGIPSYKRETLIKIKLF